LAFPCNQFGLQENSKNEEILPSMKYVRPGNGFVPLFPMFQKILVNGDNAHPGFKMLKELFPDTEPSDADWIYDQDPSHLKSTPVKRGEIRWNFEKFLIDRDGKPLVRFSHKQHMEIIEPQLLRLVESSKEPK